MHDHDGTVEWEKDQAKQIRDLVIEFIARHEQEVHDGEPCDTVRVGVFAFLAHSVGVTTALALQSFPTFLAALSEYEKMHQAHFGGGNGYHGNGNHE